MNKRKIGVLVMSYGTPESMEQVEAYYTHIRRGRPPTPEQLQNLQRRYEAIGGVFPLRDNTDKQVRALEQTLNDRVADVEFVCYHGLKHAAPYIEDGVEQMVKDGLHEAVGIVLAPHYSVMSVGGYIKRARDKAEEAGLSMSFVQSYHLHPQLIAALSERLREALAAFAPEQRERIKVVFTAHSLPEKIIEMGDPYPQQLRETSQAVAQQASVADWSFAWQSAGQTADPWLGPDILDALRALRTEEQAVHVIICPAGFVSDHLEVLYDIDIECQQEAERLGMKLVRTRSLNTDPKYMAALSDSIVLQLREMKGNDSA